MRNQSVRLAALAAAMLMTAPGLGALAPSAVAAPAKAVPEFKLQRAQKVVTAQIYGGIAAFDLGVYAVAGRAPFEVRAYRSDYRRPIRGVQVRPGADRRLPAGLLRDFTGLSRFYSLSIKNARNRSVVQKTVDFCPNTYQSMRLRPTAPATSPYPQSCFGNPYSVGAVYGIQRGHGVSAGGYQEVKLAPGSYTATLAVTGAYRKALRIKAADARVSVQLRVVKGAEEQEPSTGVAGQGGPSFSPPRLVGKSVKPSGPLPDLRPLPAWAISVDKGRYLNFAATVWNAGRSPLVVDGFRQQRREDRMDAYQYFFNSSGRQVGYAPVGTMEWDARDGHTHWHFTDFARYALLNERKKLVVRSQKEAFCLANTEAVDYTLPGANWRPGNRDLGSACGDATSIGVREVLDSGSGDTYGQSLPGQSFDLKGLKNGVYSILVEANPAKRLHESSTTNNRSYRKVTIGGAAGRRTVKVEQVGMVVEPRPMDREDEGH